MPSDPSSVSALEKRSPGPKLPWEKQCGDILPVFYVRSSFLQACQDSATPPGSMALSGSCPWEAILEPKSPLVRSSDYRR